jgi:hypothetical protein
MRKLATYQGIIENGRVTLPPNSYIPEKTRVFVLVPGAETEADWYVASPRLAHPEQAEDFKMQVSEYTKDDGI